ncbi:MAG: ATP-binding protein, partial [Bacteroidota bacterium]|nr:ATP-binding protein [Candidatus Kapabacteria bacterium]MDW8220974.1 ATP-binding protein [Bacteroidota bacterium]
QFLMYKVSADRQRVEEIHRTTTIPPRAAYTQAMLEDRSGILWIGSPHGLVRYDPVHNTARSYSWQPDDSTALPNNFVTAITETRSGELWLATKGGGICRFNPNTETFTTINSSHGLPHDDCYAVIEDDNGRLWISTDNGIAVYEPHRRTIRCFGLEHGLQGKEYNRFAHYRSARTGEIFFGGVDGLNSFFPNDIHTNSVPPIPAFLAVLAPNGTTLTRNITLCGIQRVEIPPQTGVIIRCAALEFTLPHHNLFSWKLDGVDTAWSPASRNSSAIYSTLSPGEYTFRLRTANADNVWSPQEAVLTLVVLPAWWQTWYAIMGFILSGIAFVVLLVRTRVRHLKAQAQQLQALVEARTHALQQVNQELQSKNQLLLELNAEMHEIMGIVSHDLKNPLASIIGITEILQSAHEIALTQDMHHKLLSQIASASERMLHLIRNLLDINALEAGKIQPNFAMCSVNSTARVVVEEYSTKAAGKSLSLHFSEAHYDIVYADETMLYQVIANLVSNAIKYSPHNRNIWVRLTNPLPYNGHQALLLSVKDEGPGISVEDQQRLFKRFARLSARPTGGEDSTGLGLSIVKKMVELMNGRVWCESTLGYGAEFIVEFPLALPASERVVPPTQHRQLPTP